MQHCPGHFRCVTRPCQRVVQLSHVETQALNPKCVQLAVRTAIALNSNVQSRSAFDRKHYFYSDLPAGYQVTQRYGECDASLPRVRPCRVPMHVSGSTVGERRLLGLAARWPPSGDHPDTVGTGLQRISTRATPPFSPPLFFFKFQDTAKSVFDARRRITQVDLNRAGSGLMEIVSEPDMRSVLHRGRIPGFEDCVVQVSRRGGGVCAHSPSHPQGGRG